MAEHTPVLVMSVHGIRTHAEWQSTLSEVLNQQRIQFKNRKFGYYPLACFLRSGRNQKEVDAFFDWYTESVEKYAGVIDIASPRKRPSVIAHSFGAYIVGWAMLKYPEIKFDKIILCGSILPSDFDWNTLFARGQVGRVLNEYGGRDLWVTIAPLVVRGTGRSGRDGFVYLGSRCRSQEYELHGHSDFFQAGHIRGSWLPFLRSEPCSLTALHGSFVATEQEFERLIHRTRAIDRVRFGAEPGHEVVAIPYGYSRQWRAINPDIYTFLLDKASGKVCGYINAMPLEEEVFEDVLAGRLFDNQIPGRAIVPYQSDQQLKLYIMSIAVSPSVARPGEGLYNEPLETLLDAFIARLRFYSRTRNIKIDEVGAVGWTQEGERLCERVFQMRRSGDLQLPVAPSGSGPGVVRHPVFRLRLSKESVEQPVLRYRGLRQLIKSYESG